jgi:predicted nucleotidyltransferase/thymidylate kinase
MGSLICIGGPNKSVKKSLAMHLAEFLQEEYYPAEYVRLKFPYFFTLIWQFLEQWLKPALIREKVPTLIYIWIVTLDTTIQYLVRFWLKRKIGFILVSDQSFLDILVYLRDVIDPDFLNSKMVLPLRSFVFLPDVTVIVDTSGTTSNAQEVAINKDIIKYHVLYRRISAAYGIPILKNKSELVSYIREAKIYTGSLRKPFANVKSPLLRLLFGRKVVAFIVNWVLQNIYTQTWSERSFKLLIELIILVLLAAPLSLTFSPIIAFIVGFIIAHTINWTFNGGVRTIGKFYGATYSVQKTLHFLYKLQNNTKALEKGFCAIAIFGSISRERFGESSDIDMRAFRKPGFVNWIRANLLAFSIRSRAFLDGVPLDLMVFDSIADLSSRIRADEPPVVLFDPEGLFGGRGKTFCVDEIFKPCKTNFPPK